MVVFISKYALSGPILVRDVCEQGANSNYIVVEDDASPSRKMIVGKPFWHLSFDEAKRHAEELRDKKMASLRKQIAKLKKMDWEQ